MRHTSARADARSQGRDPRGKRGVSKGTSNAKGGDRIGANLVLKRTNERRISVATRDGSPSCKGADAQALVHPCGGRIARRRGTDSMSVPRSDPPELATAITVARRVDKRRRRCRVTVRASRSNPSRRVRSSGSAADKAGRTTASSTLRRSDVGRPPGEVVAVGSAVRCSFVTVQAAKDDRRTRSGISARRQDGAGDGTVEPSRETEGGVSARAAHAQAAATLAGDTVTGRAIRDTGSSRGVARIDPPWHHAYDACTGRRR